MQSAVVVQAVLQAPPAHTNGEQSWTPLSTQVPLPLQVSARFADEALAQLAATHTVPGA